MTRVPMIRASYFAWLIVPAALVWGYYAYGAPHLLWEYRYHSGHRQSAYPYGDRSYTDCTYIGPLGALPVAALGGECPIVRFFKAGPASRSGFPNVGKGAAVEAQSLIQTVKREAFEDDQDGFAVGIAICNRPVANLARRQAERLRIDVPPKLFIAERFKKRFQIFEIFKRLHSIKIANRSDHGKFNRL